MKTRMLILYLLQLYGNSGVIIPIRTISYENTHAIHLLKSFDGNGNFFYTFIYVYSQTCKLLTYNQIHFRNQR